MWHNLIKANLAYAVGSVANSLAMLLLLPYLVNALTPEAYGAWALFEVAILLLTMLILSGLDVGLMREYWLLTDEAAQARLVGTILIAVALWGGVLAGGATAFLVVAGVELSLPGAPYTLMGVLSPLRTALYHMLEYSPIVTLPMTLAPSATYAVSSIIFQRNRAFLCCPPPMGRR